MRPLVALALLIAASLGCSSPRGAHPTTTVPPARSSGAGSENGAPLPAKDDPSELTQAASALPADAGAAKKPQAPTFDEEMACRRAHCYPQAAKHCFDTCYKYNHPRDPDAHTACNDNCRQSWDVEACEQACALDRRAYDTRPGLRGGTCASPLGTCRQECGAERPNSCELSCLAALAACEESRPTD